jgi:hypothetical protein
MAAETYGTFWRKALAIGILPFAALGVAGCDNTEGEEDTTADEEVVEQDPTVAPTSEETVEGEEQDTLGDDEVVEEDPTAGAEQPG